MLSDYYQHQTTNNFEKLLKQEDVENTSKVATPIFLTIGMYIRLTRFLEVSPPNAEYNSEGKLREGCTGVDCGDKGEIEEVMTVGNDKNDDDENLRDKTRRLRKEKQW